MTPHVPDHVSGWLAELSLVTFIYDLLPPRGPNDSDNEDEEDGEDEDEDEDEEEEPAVSREPDE
jgi:hypothetical protein